MAAKNTGNAGKGRKKGSKNKATLHAKKAIEEAFDLLGGVKGLVKWIRADDENKTSFYKVIYPKLLPVQETTAPENPEPIPDEFL